MRLPLAFRVDDALAIHRRDPASLAESVQGQVLNKGLCWQGRPARLQLRFTPRMALAELAVDDAAREPTEADVTAFSAMLERMLGLQIDANTFEELHVPHPVLGPLLRQQRGLRPPAMSTPFEALVWAIAGQQISVAAATALRRRMLAACGLRHSSGMLCFPDAAALMRLEAEDLRAAGFSASKIASVRAVGAAVLDGSLPLEDWAVSATVPVADIEARLLAIKGIGPWTVHYTLLRGFGWLDGSLHGDVAVRNALARLLQVESVSPLQTQQWLSEFSPWRALVAAHLWASLSVKSF
ncbi:MAG: DNA-3-methyladenine glycosylase 2 [Comamonas sp.]